MYGSSGELSSGGLCTGVSRAHVCAPMFLGISQICIWDGGKVCCLCRICLWARGICGSKMLGKSRAVCNQRMRWKAPLSAHVLVLRGCGIPFSPRSLQEAQPLPWEGCRSLGMQGWSPALSLCPKRGCHYLPSELQGSDVPGSKPKNFGISPDTNLPGNRFLVQPVLCRLKVSNRLKLVP